MKKYMFLLLLFPVWVSAQNREIIEAVSGEDLTGKVSTHMQYLFPEFTDGEVYYPGSPKISGMLNYNMLLGEMQFIENDKVLALDNVDKIIMITIGHRKFYPFNGREFTEEILSTGKVKLRVKRRGNAVENSRKGAYGASSSTSAITSYSSLSSDSRQHNLTVEENVLITLDCFYYIVGTNDRHIQIRNQKTFTKQFPGHRTQIETFVKEHNTRFDNEDDLKALTEYCSKL